MIQVEIQKTGEDATELDFEPVREGWNHYRLSDGSLLRIRPIVFKVFHSQQMTIEGKPLIGYAASNVISVRVPDELKKNKLPEGEPTSEEKTPIEFETIQEIWNEFKCEGDMKLRVKLVMSRVIRTSKFNSFGEPIYVVSSGNVADVQVEAETS